MVYSTMLPLRVAHHVILTVIILFWFLKYGVPNTMLLWPVLLSAGAVALSVVGAQDRRMALEYAWHWWTNGALLLICTSWYQQARERELITVAILSGVLVAATCVLEAALYSGRPGGLLLNVNLAGGFIAALIVPTLARARHDWKYAPALLLFGVALLLNQSRGAFLCVGVAVAAFYILRRVRFYWWSIPLGAGALVGILSLNAGHSSGDVVRMDLWRVAQSIIESKPLGVGVGLFGQAYQQLGSGNGFRFLGAHNYYLNLGAELGGVGLAAGAAALLIVGYGLIGRKRTVEQDASLAALVGIAAHMLGDNFPTQGYTLLVSLYVAHLLYQWQIPFTLPSKLKYVASGVLVAGVLMMLRFDRAQIVYERSLSTGSYSAALEALQLDPDNRLYQINYSRAAHDGDLSAALTIDPTIPKADSLMLYGLVNYGRVFK